MTPTGIDRQQPAVIETASGHRWSGFLGQETGIYKW
jgi:hypothetical protein